MNAKLQWLRNKMSSLDLQGFIITNPVNIRYLTNIDAEGILLITRKENIYITDSRYIEQVHSTLTLFDEIIVYDVHDVSKDDYENFFLFCENVGFEEYNISYAKYKEYIRKFKIYNFVETEYMIEKQRMIKDQEEISNIQKACEITDNCFEYILSYIKPGMTERQIANEIEEYYKQRSGGLAFDTIVASGENTSKPHAVPTNRKIQEKDIITIDMGCQVNGYCSDMTRTFFVGEVLEEVKPIYDLVLKNQKQTGEQYKDGISTRLIAKMVENDFKLYGYNLVHSLGHGVGMEIHEAPYISYKSDTQLKENMVVTNEPGIYLAGKFGVRIEDTVLITKFGCINLTKSGKDYIIIS
ncbi:MAG: aminopeptidase P family protein [Clostridia bacterium]|nr:aminopeptidase P family protein [Clostridia bacterium]